MKKLIYILIPLLFTSVLESRTLQDSLAIEWVSTYDGSGNSDDWATSVLSDSESNVYVTGTSWGTDSDADFYTIKYSPDGSQQWGVRYNGPANFYDKVKDMKIDRGGNVYITGTSFGSSGGYEFATIKYNTDGDLEWTARYDGPGLDHNVVAMAIDDSFNVYVTGISDGAEDFETTNFDFATIKYDSTGNEQWVARYDGELHGRDRPRDISIDNEGNVYVTGFSRSSYNGYDYATIKYNSSGVEEWVRTYVGTEQKPQNFPYALDLDRSYLCSDL